MSDPGAPGRSRRGPLVGVAIGVVVALLTAIALLGSGDPEGSDTGGGGPSDAEDVEAADDDAVAADGARNPDSTSAAAGPEGTREFAEVPDEIPDGLVPDSAQDIEGTVARGGDDWSAVVVFRSGDDRPSLERGIDDATEAAGFTRRDAVEDRERRVIRYDGADGSVLSVTLRTDGDEQVVGAALVGG